MMREYPVRFCERLGVRILHSTRPVVGFQHKHEAERFLDALKERMKKFGLALHPEKTRLIEFGRFASINRARRGGSKPETFNFLGFTHICARNQQGTYTVLRNTITKRMRTKLQELKREMMRRRHEPVTQVGKWLRAVVQGYFNLKTAVNCSLPVFLTIPM